MYEADIPAKEMKAMGCVRRQSVIQELVHVLKHTHVHSHEHVRVRMHTLLIRDLTHVAPHGHRTRTLHALIA